MNHRPDPPTEPSTGPTAEDLAAFALDALDGDERRRVADRLVADPAAAASERRFRQAAGELGASGVVPVDGIPPAPLRARVLEAARRRRPPEGGPATAPAMHRTELARALTLVRRLDSSDWLRPVDPPELAGWTVGDVVSHLAANEALLAAALGVGAASVPETTSANEARTDQVRRRHRHLAHEAVIAELEAAASAVDAHVTGLDPAGLDRTVTFWERPTSIGGVLLVRSFETWTHADDIRRAVGLDEVAPPAASLRTMSRAAVGLVPEMLRVRSTYPPSGRIRVHLTGPAEETWDVDLSIGGAETPTGRPVDTELTVDTVDFCRAVSDRLPAGGLPYTCTGDTVLAAIVVAAVPALAVL